MTDRPLPLAKARGALTRSDPGLFVAAFGLSIIGVMLTWSATEQTAGDAFLVRGGVNLLVGLALAGIVLRTDHRTVRALVPAVYGVAVLALVLVLSPVGSTINGSKSWITLPGFSIQPAEIAKVGLVLALASVLAGTGEPDERPTWPQIRLAAGGAAVPFLLVMLQPDLGSGLVLVALVIALVAASGVHRGWVLGAIGAVAAAAAIAVTTPVLATYQRDRLLAFVRPEADPGGIGYQVQQVKLAIGSGGWFGQGLFHGRSTQGGFIPFQYTDFVFSVAGEELGFMGAFGVVLLEMFLVWRIVVVGRRQADPFGRLVCAGIAGWLLFQALENIGMNVGLMPVTGVPLPFVSYGGSSLFSCWIAIGLVGKLQLSDQRRLK